MKTLKPPHFLISCCRLTAAAALSVAALAGEQAAPIVLDNVRVIDGTGAAPIDNARIVINGDRLVRIGPAEAVPVPPEAEIVDLTGRTVIPGLIDLHFHIENDPKLALRQLSHGVTAFRDPGQWEEKFTALRRMIAAEQLPDPRIFTAGPHIDGEGPAYPADAVVARDAEEARRLAERNVELGASALKIYFRLPFASAKAVIDVCKARRVPCTAHLELLDARELLTSGLHGIEHITSLGLSLLPRIEAEAYRQAVLTDNDARRDGRYKMFASIDLNGPEAQRLYSVLAARQPWLDATLAVFERRPPSPLRGSGATGPPSPLRGSGATGPPSPLRGSGETGPRSSGRGSGATSGPRGPKPETAASLVQGFAKMKQLTRRAHQEGARLVMGGHSTVPFAGRGEAPWREVELLVESGLSPLEAITAATGTAAAFLYRSNQLGRLRPGLQADVVVLRNNPLESISGIRSVERVMVAGRWIDVARYRKF